MIPLVTSTRGTYEEMVIFRDFHGNPSEILFLTRLCFVARGCTKFNNIYSTYWCYIL
jgi:hypothetical protein